MPPHLPFALSRITDFLKAQQRFAKVEGFLTELEGYTLMELAAHGEGMGAIVEIGSFFGRSTAFLAAGAKSTGREKVYAVDHFRGSPENQKGQPFAHPVLEQQGSTFGVFHANLERLGLSDQVVPVRNASVDASSSWDGPVRLLFIDGEHSYEASRADYEAWSPFVVNRGYICFHDITVWPGVTKLYQELLHERHEIRELCAVQSLRVAQKKSG
jgi:predicted O-methyltransferase YrrM